MTIDESVIRDVLWRLSLRQTIERQEVTRLFLEYPGLSAGMITTELQARAADVHRRTVYRLLSVLLGPKGSLVRWEVVGPVWVCWGCGAALASARDDLLTARFQSSGLLPLDLGGYCAECQNAMATPGTLTPPGLRHGRSASPFTNRRAAVVPVRALYEHPRITRELLGSERRLAQRDYIVANLAENPRSGPSAVHRLLDDELALVPTLRSVKRASGALHGPKAQMLFSSLGAAGWSCLGCAAWGSISDTAPLRHNGPERFHLTDIRALCADCRNSSGFTCHNRAN